MKQHKIDILNLWYMALASPYGIEVECLPNFEAVRNKLYNLKHEVKDPDLKGISLCQSPFDPGRLWLVKKEPSDAAP